MAAKVYVAEARTNQPLTFQIRQPVTASAQLLNLDLSRASTPSHDIPCIHHPQRLRDQLARSLKFQAARDVCCAEPRAPARRGQAAEASNPLENARDSAPTVC